MRFITLVILTLILLVTPLHSQTAQPLPASTADMTYLLAERGFSDDISSLYVSEQQDRIVVQLSGGSSRTGGPSNPQWTPLKDLGIQVWVLRADGTALAQRPHSGEAGSIANAGWSTDVMQFAFENAPSDKIAAVVLRVNGQLFVRPIQTPSR
jgi:hypothetical protein